MNFDEEDDMDFCADDSLKKPDGTQTASEFENIDEVQNSGGFVAFVGLPDR